MENVKLMTKVIDLDTKKLSSRLEIQKAQLQISVIRKAYGVLNGETDAPVKSYFRERALSNEEITKNFNEYVGFYKWAIETNREDKVFEFKNSLHFFIEAVHFFDTELARKLQNQFDALLKQTA